MKEALQGMGFGLLFMTACTILLYIGFSVCELKVPYREYLEKKL